MASTTSAFFVDDETAPVMVANATTTLPNAVAEDPESAAVTAGTGNAGAEISANSPGAGASTTQLKAAARRYPSKGAHSYEN